MSANLFGKTTADCLENKSLELRSISFKHTRHHDSRLKYVLQELVPDFVVELKISSAIFDFQLFNALSRMRGRFSTLSAITLTLLNNWYV